MKQKRPSKLVETFDECGKEMVVAKLEQKGNFQFYRECNGDTVLERFPAEVAF